MQGPCTQLCGRDCNIFSATAMQKMALEWFARHSMSCWPCRDGLLRGELEACLMFAPPSELLVAQPMTSPSQKLLGSYVSQRRRLRSETVPRSKYSDAAGLAAVTAFYGASGEAAAMIVLCGCDCCLLSP